MKSFDSAGIRMWALQAGARLGWKTEVGIEPVEKGGSDRKFFRLRRLNGVGETAILMIYNLGREENRHFAALAEFLKSCAVRVPEVYFHDERNGIILMQDLGEQDLWSMRKLPWAELRQWYRRALEEIVGVHGKASRKLKETAVLNLQREFDEGLYLWEQGYFIEHCLAGYFGLSEADLEVVKKMKGLLGAARRLAQLPRRVIHRDFQSQNVIIAGGAAWLIDFQGMRLGLPHYDLASLLYDPYVDLELARHDELVGVYRELAFDEGIDVGEDFYEIFRLCTMQRLMQALGAYGYLGLKRGLRRFLSYIPVAKRRLEIVVAEIPGLESLLSILQSCETNEASYSPQLSNTPCDR